MALAVHGAPQTLTRWLAPPLPMKLRRTVERTAAEPHGIVLVRGEAHRRKVAGAYGVHADDLQILPPSVPLDAMAFRPVTAQPREVLAMTRLAPEKMPILRLALELVRGRLAGGHECQLTVAGDGALRAEAIELCERGLPASAWRAEGAPDDPIARLAACDLVVAQGTTTLEAAALGRPVVVARPVGAREASGTVLVPGNYDGAARDPFGNPRVTEDTDALWKRILEIDNEALTELRQLVAEHNSPETAAKALDTALSTDSGSSLVS